jgi:hypothetical protein
LRLPFRIPACSYTQASLANHSCSVLQIEQYERLKNTGMLRNRAGVTSYWVWIPRPVSGHRIINTPILTSPFVPCRSKTVEQLDLKARCTGCVSGWSASAPASSMRSAPSCWSAALQSARVFAFCGASLPKSSRRAPTPCRRGWRASSSNWLATGTGWTSASRAYRPRSQGWPIEMQHANG